MPSKAAHNQPSAKMAQTQKSHTIKSPLMQDWVFRLGSVPEKSKYGAASHLKLLKLLSVVCEFGWQTYDSKNNI